MNIAGTFNHRGNSNFYKPGWGIDRGARADDRAAPIRRGRIAREAGPVVPVDVAPDGPPKRDEAAEGEARAGSQNTLSFQKITHGQPHLRCSSHFHCRGILKHVESRTTHMPNITLSIPEEIYELMKKHPEVKWSEVARKAIIDYVRRLEGIISSEELLEDLGDEVKEILASVSIEAAEDYAGRVREAEWRRFSSIGRLDRFL